MKSKTSIVYFLLFLYSTSVTASINSLFAINGNVSSQFENKTVSLNLLNKDSTITLLIDTIKNGKFAFNGIENLNYIAIIELNDPNYKLSCDVFLEQGNIDVFLDSISFVTGTPLNDLYQNYMSYSRRMDENLVKEYNLNVENKENPKTEYFDLLMKKRTEFKRQFQLYNINNIVGKTVYIREIGTFWDPLFFQTYDTLPSDIKENVSVLNYVSIRKEMDEAQIRVSHMVGSKLIDAEFTTENGNKVLISNYLDGSEYLYIDLWASWCVPCIRELPSLKLIQEKYNNKRLNVLLISIDNDFDLWINSIKINQLSFNNLIDQTAGELLHKVFAYTTIPHGILLDKNGVIVSNQLKIDTLKKKMFEIYGY